MTIYINMNDGDSDAMDKSSSGLRDTRQHADRAAHVTGLAGDDGVDPRAKPSAWRLRAWKGSR